MSPKNYFGSTHKNHRHSTSTHILHEHFCKVLENRSGGKHVGYLSISKLAVCMQSKHGP